MLPIYPRRSVSVPLLAFALGSLTLACGLDTAGALVSPPAEAGAGDTGKISAPKRDAGHGDASKQEAASTPPDTGTVHPDAGMTVDATTDTTVPGNEASTPEAAPPEAAPPLDASHDSNPMMSDTGHDAAQPDASSNPCPALTFAAGVKIQTFENAAMTAQYANHLINNEAAPTCFLDLDNLINPDTQEVYAITVNVATHFQLDELVGTEPTLGYGHIVLIEPLAVAALEAFRETLNTPVTVDSGFRTPKHQEDICVAICSNALGCGSDCPVDSRHIFGDAFDLPNEFYTAGDEQTACDSGFKFATQENSPGEDIDLHIDQNPVYATCNKDL